MTGFGVIADPGHYGWAVIEPAPVLYGVGSVQQSTPYNPLCIIRNVNIIMRKGVNHPSLNSLSHYCSP